ncbi:MAG TPA: histidine--tRNA ligase, partial [Sphingomonadaceae bacterium]
PIFAVVPDRPSMANEAHRIAAHLRANSHDQYRIWTAFRGNSKSQSEKAKKDGVDAIIYVREDNDPRKVIHVTNLGHSNITATFDLMHIQRRLPAPYSVASGGDE